MRIIRSFIPALGLLSLSFFVACDDDNLENEGDNGGEDGTDADDEEDSGTMPSEYEDYENPFDGDSDAEDDGQEIYEAKCERCHGEDGDGEGPDADELEYDPSDFTTSKAADLEDGFMYWRVEEGVPDEDMPGWGGSLDEDEIWQVIAYIRTFSD